MSAHQAEAQTNEEQECPQNRELVISLLGAHGVALLILLIHFLHWKVSTLAAWIESSEAERDCEVLLIELPTHSPVVVAPREALGDKLAGDEALHELDDLEVGHALDLRVLGQVEVLLSVTNALCGIGANTGSATRHPPC